MRSKYKYENSGFTLIELLIAISLISIIGVGSTIFFNQSYSSFNYLRFSIRQSNIARYIDNEASRLDSILASAEASSHLSDPGNKALAACLPRKGAKGRKSCRPEFTDPTNQVPFNLLLPVGGKQTPTRDNIQKRIIAGVETTYNLSGGLCPPGKILPGCQFEARAYFWATCAQNSQGIGSFAKSNTKVAGNPTRCDFAQTIHVRYQVSHIYSPGTYGINHPLGAIPANDVFWADDSKTKGTTMHSVSFDVASIKEIDFGLACPLNETIISMQDGAPTCQCLYPFSKIPDGNGQEICDRPEQICPPNKRYAGTYKDTNGDWQVLCRDFVCSNIPVRLSEGCPSGSYIGKVMKRSTPTSPENGCTTNGSTCKYDPENLSCQIPIDCDLMATCCHIR